MGAITVDSIWRSEAQLRPKQPRVETTDLVASVVPSSSAPSTFTAGGVTLKAIMAQLQHMDSCLDSLSDEMC